MARVRTLLIFFIVFLNQYSYNSCTWGIGFLKEDLGLALASAESSRSTNAESSRSALKTKSNESLESFVSNWNDVNSAVEVFIQKYEAQHQTTIKVDRRLEKIDGFREGEESLRLKYSFQKDDENRWSSVLIQIRHLRPHNQLEQKLLLHDKEKYMYENVFPRMYSSWSREKLTPDFYASTNESRVLIIENLQEAGFEKRVEHPFNLSLCKQVFKTLAQFHALSIARVDAKVYAGLDSLTVTYMTHVLGETDFLPIFEKFRKYVSPSLSEGARRQFEHVVQNHRFILNAAHSPNLEGFNVLIHGNLSWATTFVREDVANNVIACKFDDFQSSRRGSPVIDLMKFIMTSARLEVFQTEDRDALLNCYLDELRKAYREAGGADDQNLYSLDQLRLDLRKYKSYFVSWLILTAPIYLSQFAGITIEGEDVHEFFFNSQWFLRVFKYWVETLE